MMTLNLLKELYEKANNVGLSFMKKDMEYFDKNDNFCFKNTKEGKELLNQSKVAHRDFYNAFDTYERENGLVWDNETWITNIYGDFCAYEDGGTLELARQKLLDKLSKMNGVRVYNDAKGVKSVIVNTKDKTYTYSIHAYCCVEKVGTQKEIGIFGKEWERDITRPGCQGCVYKNTFNSKRDKMKEFRETYVKGGN